MPLKRSPCPASLRWSSFRRKKDRAFSIQEHAMRKVLRAYANDKNGNLSCRSPLARTNALQQLARKKYIWSGKAQRSLRKKRFVNLPLDRTPGEISPATRSYFSARLSRSNARLSKGRRLTPCTLTALD